MEQNIRKIKIVIKEIFEHEHKNYIFFNLEDNKFDYLFVVNVNNSNQSLFYGEDFEPIILKCRKVPEECIECALGFKVKGGVSFDDNSLVDFNLKINEADEIISAIMNYLKENKYAQLRDRIKLFKSLT